MPTLSFLRHAKSSWEDPSLQDVDRPLNQRGKQDCRAMASVVMENPYEKIYCSTAVRARDTIRRVNEHTAQPTIGCEPSSILYTFDFRELLNWCRQLDPKLNSVLVVGHNPAITDFCNHIADANIDNVPTCGFVRLNCQVKTWDQISPGTAKVVEFLSPKKLSR